MAAIDLPAAGNLSPRLVQGLTARELLCPAREGHGLEPVAAESERPLPSFHGKGGMTQSCGAVWPRTERGHEAEPVVLARTGCLIQEGIMTGWW